MPRRTTFWTALAVGVAAGALVVLERRRPLRRRREAGLARLARNVSIGVTAALTTAAADLVVVGPAQRLAERHRLGLLRAVRLPRVVRFVLGFLLLDYTLFLWHWLNHRSASLWRFHAVHHIDRDLDATTGIRFHFGELALAAGLRAAQILIIGADRATLRAWQRLLFVSVLFHHSNLDLPEPLERALVTVLATPRMHGIHHSERDAELHTNFASLLSWWDHLHGTFRFDVPQQAITTGVAGFDDTADVSLERSLALPFSDDPRLASSLLKA